MKTIRLIIHETGRNFLAEPACCFNVIRETFENKNQLKDYLIDRYGKIPKGKKKIYTGNPPKIIGFLHSFWNQDVSHASKKWYQTDWIEIYQEETIRTPLCTNGVVAFFNIN